MYPTSISLCIVRFEVLKIQIIVQKTTGRWVIFLHPCFVFLFLYLFQKTLILNRDILLRYLLRITIFENHTSFRWSAKTGSSSPEVKICRAKKFTHGIRHQFSLQKTEVWQYRLRQIRKNPYQSLNLWTTVVPPSINFSIGWNKQRHYLQWRNDIVNRMATIVVTFSAVYFFFFHHLCLLNTSFPCSRAMYC